MSADLISAIKKHNRIRHLRTNLCRIYLRIITIISNWVEGDHVRDTDIYNVATLIKEKEVILQL